MRIAPSSTLETVLLACLVAAMSLSLPHPVQGETPAKPTAPAKPMVPEGEALRALAVGTWKFKFEKDGLKAEGITEYKADGTMASKGFFEILGEKMPVDVEGKWRVDGTSLIWEVTKTNDPDLFAVGEKSVEQILSIDSKRLKYRDEDGMVWEEIRVTKK